MDNIEQRKAVLRESALTSLNREVAKLQNWDYSRSDEPDRYVEDVKRIAHQVIRYKIFDRAFTGKLEALLPTLDKNNPDSFEKAEELYKFIYNKLIEEAKQRRQL